MSAAASRDRRVDEGAPPPTRRRRCLPICKRSSAPPPAAGRAPRAAPRAPRRWRSSATCCARAAAPTARRRSRRSSSTGSSSGRSRSPPPRPPPRSMTPAAPPTPSPPSSPGCARASRWSIGWGGGEGPRARAVRRGVSGALKIYGEKMPMEWRSRRQPKMRRRRRSSTRNLRVDRFESRPTVEAVQGRTRPRPRCRSRIDGMQPAGRRLRSPRARQVGTTAVSRRARAAARGRAAMA